MLLGTSARVLLQSSLQKKSHNSINQSPTVKLLRHTQRSAVTAAERWEFCERRSDRETPVKGDDDKSVVGVGGEDPVEDLGVPQVAENVVEMVLAEGPVCGQHHSEEPDQAAQEVRPRLVLEQQLDLTGKPCNRRDAHVVTMGFFRFEKDKIPAFCSAAKFHPHVSQNTE